MKIIENASLTYSLNLLSKQRIYHNFHPGLVWSRHLWVIPNLKLLLFVIQNSAFAFYHIAAKRQRGVSFSRSGGSGSVDFIAFFASPWSFLLGLQVDLVETLNFALWRGLGLPLIVALKRALHSTAMISLWAMMGVDLTILKRMKVMYAPLD